MRLQLEEAENKRVQVQKLTEVSQCCQTLVALEKRHCGTPAVNPALFRLSFSLSILEGDWPSTADC